MLVGHQPKEFLLAVEALTVSFDGFKAVNDLSFYVDENEIRVIIGPNGAGKTTCLLYTSPSPRDGLLSRMPSSA